MNISNKQLLHGCLLSSIAHAIMTNIYPELSYEQSWDGYNYSVQSDDGIRGTITFGTDYCVGAIRNENGVIVYGNEAISNLCNNFPSEILNVAKAETLQYLLDYQKNAIVPAVTSIFWCDINGLYWACDSFSDFKNDIKLFSTCILPQNRAIAVLQEYYGMDSEALRLLYELLDQKDDNLSTQIILSPSQKNMIPGGFLFGECKEAFSEMNIVV